jgi:hypothetical protein
MAQVMRSSFARIIDIGGNTNVTYSLVAKGTPDAYGEPTTTYSSVLITALVQPLDDKELNLREPGFDAQHYTKLFMHHTADLTPNHLDKYMCNGIEFEVRSVIPRAFDDEIIYYEIVGRRL